MTDRALSVLVVDDTATYRKIVSDAIASMDCVKSTATAPTGEVALMKLAQSHFDLVLLDVEMPGIGGLETLVRIKRDFPDAEVVMISGVTERGASVTIKAMNAGAFEFVRKPSGGGGGANVEELREALRGVIDGVRQRRTVGAKAQGAKAGTAVRAPAAQAVRSVPTPTRFAVLAIGVSTGGPNALRKVIPALPGDFPLPVVLVQHMPAPFTKALADDLDRQSALEVREAQESDPVRPGRVLIAPGSRHMVLRATGTDVVAGINDGPKENSCRPSVDVLFRSVAACYGAQGALAVIMTGMGSDGLKGVQALKRKGCRCLTQSEKSCVVYGMPQAVDAAGLSDESVDLDRIAGRLTVLASKGGKQI